jgi:hypothetical protein
VRSRLGQFQVGVVECNAMLGYMLGYMLNDRRADAKFV